MSATEEGTANRDSSVGQVDVRLEIQVIPVSDVDRSKQFYGRLGWRLDDAVAPMDGLRILQFTPPARAPRSRSAWDSRPPRRARPRGADRFRYRSGTSRTRQPWDRRE